MTPDVLTVEEVAQRLRISTRQVRRMMRENRIGYIKVGDRLRVVPVTSFEEFLKRELVSARTD